MKTIWIQCSFIMHLILHNDVLCNVQVTYEIKSQNGGYNKSNIETNARLENYDGGDYGGYGNWDYEISFYEYKLEEIRLTQPIIDCYTCHYTKKEYYDFGMPNCDYPFNNKGIPIVSCKGLCGRTKSILWYEQYMIIRSCLPNCKNIYDAVTSVECCFGHRCNGAKSDAVIHYVHSMTIRLVFISAFVCALCYCLSDVSYSLFHL